MGPSTPVYQRFVAVGDSFCEGVGDRAPDLPNGVRGWADRLAEVIAGGTARAGGPPLRYANLAVRGKLLAPIVEAQVEPALAMEPDLIAVCAGANDLLRPSVDIDELMARYDDALAALTTGGATVVTFTAFDTVDRPLFSAMRGRFAIYNELLREIVERRRLTLVDFWRMREFSERRMWEFDRMHLSTNGHRQMTIRVAQTLGLDHDLTPVRLGPPPTTTPGQRRKDNRRWVTQEAAPWIGRRVRGVSRGDAMAARYPRLWDVEPNRGGR